MKFIASWSDKKEEMSAGLCRNKLNSFPYKRPFWNVIIKTNERERKWKNMASSSSCCGLIRREEEEKGKRTYSRPAIMSLDSYYKGYLFSSFFFFFNLYISFGSSYPFK